MIIRKIFLRLMTAALIAVIVMGGSGLVARAQNSKPASLDIEAMTRAIQRAVDDLAESDFTRWKLALAGGVRTFRKGKNQIIRFPGAKIVIVKPPITLDLGDIDVVFQPEISGRHAMEIRLPQSFKILDANGIATGTASFSSRKFKMAWDLALRTISMIDLELRGLNVSNKKTALPINVAKISLKGDIRKESPNLWASSVTGNIKDISVGWQFKLGEVSFSTLHSGVKLERFLSLLRDIAPNGEMGDWFFAGTQGSALGVDNFKKSGVGRKLLKRLPAFSDISRINRSQIKFEDVKFQNAFTLGEMKFGGGALSEPSGLSALTSIVNIDGLHLTHPLTLSIASLAPHGMELRLKINRFPHKALFQILADMSGGILGVVDKPLDPKQKKNQIMFLALASLPQLQQAFSDARTEIDLKRWTIDADQYGTHLSGLVKAIANAKVGMTAELTLDVKNFEMLLGTSKGFLFKRRRDLNKRSPLDILPTLGIKTKNSKGEPITRFEISITADGHIHVNNRDFGPLVP